MGGTNPSIERARDKALQTVGLFGGKAASVVGGAAQRVESMAANRIEPYGKVRNQFYQSGDFTQQSHDRGMLKATTVRERVLRKSALLGEKGVENADILKAEVAELIQARKEIQSKLTELVDTYPAKEDRAKNRAAAGGAATILWESVNWLRDWFPSSQKDCDGNAVQKAELSTWFTVLQSAALCYGSYKFFYEPVQQNFDKQQAEFKRWIDQYNTEIDAIIDDLRETGHDRVASDLVETHNLATEQHLVRSNSYA